jgi:hypothetical protein
MDQLSQKKLYVPAKLVRYGDLVEVTRANPIASGKNDHSHGPSKT